MSSVEIGLVTFGCVFGGVLVGMVIRAILPEPHFSGESKDVIKLGTGLIGTMAALVLGLLVGSAKASYDTQKDEVTQMSANVVLMDRILVLYGAEAVPVREHLRKAVEGAIARFWQGDMTIGSNAHAAPAVASAPASAPARSGDTAFEAVHQLTPTNDSQRKLQDEALGILVDLARTRVLLLQQQTGSISTPLLVVLVSWLSIIFMSFGLFAPRNVTVVAVLLICAMSVSGAIFLILELDRPFTGVVQISDVPLRNALSMLGH